jgi:hypothetical protein
LSAAAKTSGQGLSNRGRAARGIFFWVTSKFTNAVMMKQAANSSLEIITPNEKEDSPRKRERKENEK